MGDGQDQAPGAPVGSGLKGNAFSSEPLDELPDSGLILGAGTGNATGGLCGGIHGPHIRRRPARQDHRNTGAQNEPSSSFGPHGTHDRSDAEADALVPVIQATAHAASRAITTWR
jgi:hypothetical protein